MVKKDIDKICEKYRIRNYTINEDGSIDVDGGVDLKHNKLTELPLKFNKVFGFFDCGYNKLTSLKGSPKYVELDFNCENNDLTNLEYGPEYVGGFFDCRINEIRDLYGISDYIGNYLYCNKENPISSIINEPVDIDFVRAFNVYKVIKDGKVVLKRLKYVMELFDMSYDLENIKKQYTIV